MRISLPLERSTSLRFIAHDDGITTLGFRNQKTGAPTADYDYEDPDGTYFEALQSAERPGTFFRRALRAGEFPTHFAKRPAEVDDTSSLGATATT